MRDRALLTVISASLRVVGGLPPTRKCLLGNYYLVNNRASLSYTRQVGMWEVMPLQAREYLGHGDNLALQLVVKTREFTLGVGWLLVPDKGLDL
jgi:hypothetical protein